MKNFLLSLVILILCLSMTGFTFYEENQTDNTPVSLEAFLSGDTEPVASSPASAKSGVQYDYYKEFSISLPLTLGGMEVDSDSYGIFAMSPDENLVVAVMRTESYFLDEDIMDGVEALLLALNDIDDNTFSISGRQLLSHPIANKAYQHSIIIKEGSDTATCKITYLETDEAFYIFITGYLENPGSAVIDALDSIPLSLIEY